MIEHFYRSVPGWAAFEQLYFDYAERMRDGDVVVEIGSWLGRSAALMATEIANRGKKVSFFCVDPWLDGGPDLRDSEHYKGLGVEHVYDLFVKNVAPVSQHIRALRMTSVEAAKTFDDGTVDLVMIDGDHTYEAVRADIEAWLPKVKKGGMISGDDYLWPGVERACAEVLGEVQVKIKSRNKNYRNSSSYWWKTVE